jgi:hypothetical protein
MVSQSGRERCSLFIEAEGDVPEASIGNVFALGGDVQAAGAHEDRVVLARPLGVGVERRWLGLDRRRARESPPRGRARDDRVEEGIEESDGEVRGAGAQRRIFSPRDADDPLCGLPSQLPACGEVVGEGKRRGTHISSVLYRPTPE